MIIVTLIRNIAAPFKAVYRAGVLRALDTCAEVIWLAIIFLIPLSFNLLFHEAFYLFKSLLLEVLVLLLLGCTVARWVLSGPCGKQSGVSSWIRNSPLQVAVIVFCLVWIASTLASVSPDLSVRGSIAWNYGLSTLLAWIIFFLVIAQTMHSRAQVYRALYALLISSGLVSALGILQSIYPAAFPWFNLWGRIFSTTGNPLTLSGFTAALLPVTLAMITLTWYGGDKKPKQIIKVCSLALLFLLQIISLAMAQYAYTFLLFIIGMFVFLVLAGIYFKSRATLIASLAVLLVLLVTAGILIAQFLTMPEQKSAIEGQDSSDQTAMQTNLPTLGIRVYMWKSAAVMLTRSTDIPGYQDRFRQLRPLLGYGPETFIIVSQSNFPDSIKSEHTFNSVLFGQPENHFLYLGVTTGWLGLAAYLCMLAAFFCVVFRMFISARDREIAMLAAAFIAAVAQYCIHVFFNPSVILLDLVFWLVLSLTVVLSKQETSVAVDTGIVKSSQARTGNRARMGTAAAIILMSVIAGAGLVIPPAEANMKLQRGLVLRQSEPGRAVAYFAGAAAVQPPDAYYYGYLGSYLYNLALNTTDNVTRAKLLSAGIASYESGADLEPNIAYWRYSLGDLYTYSAREGYENGFDKALEQYRRADVLFPRNPVILNKWAMALILKGDYDAARVILLESSLDDPSWAQTSYYTGLLQINDNRTAAGTSLFVQPVKQKPSNLGYFVDFCRQARLLGQIKSIGAAFEQEHTGLAADWETSALAGIAHIYNGETDIGLIELNNSADNVTKSGANQLVQAVRSTYLDNTDIKESARKILIKLVGKQLGYSQQ